eukprot:10735251-Karenia_brevis.AAC.1
MALLSQGEQFITIVIIMFLGQVIGVLFWMGAGKLGSWHLGAKPAGGSIYSTGQELHVPGNPIARLGQPSAC